MARRLQQTMADYVVIAISPALIMTLVGSLVFFLLAVFYQGEFTARLHWVMICFVFAAVLISRIAIEEGFERAAPFGAALAMVVGLASNRFMEYQGTWIDSFSWLINWSLIALVWWCAHRLTWDCTVIDDTQDSSGEGLLQTAGLERSADDRDDKSKAVARRVEGTTSREVPPGFWRRYVEGQRRPHAPGVSVVYFSLAALPLFGIGQWFIPEANVAARRYVFGLLCLYVASGLGLLLTTSFLGLRRYLRQRMIEMPTLMANLWLGTGAVVIGLLLVLAALLPRPSAEYAISELPFAVGSPEQHASRTAPVPREGTHDEQPGTAPERQTDADRQEPAPADSSPADSQASGDSKDQSKSQSSSESSSKPSRSQGQAAKGDSQESKSTASKGSQRGQSSGDNKQADQQAKSAEKTDRRSALAKAIEHLRQEQARQKSDTPPRTETPQSETKSQNDTPPQQPFDATKPLEVAETGIAAAAGGIAELLKWAFYAAFALAVLYFLWRSRADVLAAIREFLAALRDLLSGLFGYKRTRAAAADHAESPIEFPPAPFSSYADPFATGISVRYSTEELVRYSFEAFEAWAREHGCPRDPDQTPHELARQVSKLNRFIAAEARNLAELYAQAAYARVELPEGASDQLRQLWQAMRPGVVRAS